MTQMLDRKPIFDRVRALLGRSFRAAEVAALDAAIDAAERVDAPSAPESAFVPHHASPAAVKLVRDFEGLARLRADGKVEAYPDPGTGGAPWTIGWGATGPDIRPGTVWTRAQCDARLEADIERHAADVRAALGIALAATSQAQFDALVSFHYNTGAIGRATLTRKHKAGDFAGAASEFARWNRAGGRVLAGLTRRRASEAKLYVSGS